MKIVMLGLTVLLLGGCAGPLKLSEADWQAAPESFGRRDLIIETSLPNVVADQPAYGNYLVEISGVPEYVGHTIGHGYWHFYLTDSAGNRLLCYERNYRVSHRSVVERLVRRAQAQGESMVVVGRLKRPGELELDWIDYGDWHLDTDYWPPSLPFIWR
ncbi:MAG: hypothetical protein J4A00_07420 [Gammaproteobacteria bacterium]|nr:hypothetical protein [Gammaproteobacteria bacterium]